MDIFAFGPHLVPTWSPIFPLKAVEKSVFLRFGPHLVPSDRHSVPLGPHLVPLGPHMVPTWSHLVRTWSPRRVKNQLKSMKYQHLVPTSSLIFPFKTIEKSTFLRFGPHLVPSDPHSVPLGPHLVPLGSTWPPHGPHLVPFGPHLLPTWSPRRAQERLRRA